MKCLRRLYKRQGSSCECGCGERVSEPGNRYIRGHNFRLGEKGTKNGFYGKAHTENARKKVSASLLGKRGEKARHWQGGRRNDSAGYVLIYQPDHPHAYDGLYMSEHRLVMEDYLGRYLSEEEVVHHINGMKDDNRRENLGLFPSFQEHMAFHRAA